MGIAEGLLKHPRDDSAIRRNAAMAGMRVELAPESPTEVWPENWTALEVASRMVSQLNVGMGGVVGFRFEALPIVLHALRVPADRELEVLDAVRVIEAHYVRVLRGFR